MAFPKKLAQGFVEKDFAFSLISLLDLYIQVSV